MSKRKASDIPCVFSATCNNPDVSPEEVLEKVNDSTSVGLKFQVESGKDNTPHYQIGVYFNKGKTIDNANKWLEKTFDKHCHTKICNTLEHCKNVYNYVSKEETRIAGPYQNQLKWPKCITDVKKIQGQRTDLKEFIEDSKTMTKQELKEKHYNVEARYSKFFDSYANAKGNSEKRICTILSAPSGSGKSTYPDTKFGKENCFHYVLNGDCKLNGYKDQENIIIDNFRVKELKRKERQWLLQLMDSFLCEVNVFGKMTPLAAKRIIITTVEHPNAWFDTTPVTRTEFFRRVKNIFVDVNGTMEPIVVKYDPPVLSKFDAVSFD